jgi:hypothetical protein
MFVRLTSQNAVYAKFAENIPSENSEEHGLLSGPDRVRAAYAEEAGLAVEGELELAPIGWQLFRLASSENDCTAFPLSLENTCDSPIGASS